MAAKTFIAMLGAGAAFIVIGIAASIYANTAVAVSLDGTVKPGLADELSPDMNVGNTALMQVKGSTFDIQVKDPDGSIVTSQKDLSNFTYELTASKAGEYRIAIQNTGNQDVQITGTAQTKSSPLEFSGSLMLVVTGIIVIGLSLRFRGR
ncbi:hypothetical protein NTE_03211 [Candidatus Nitrososphaera evergladensis SR1]|uniref:Uncharacterized protein n=1 Tax=Candidatus Nitrososphaera evergladensis SR1 TaxID=1459636 RepID=A0A075MVI5_9ARCH|nr:emp24/gp25L/p24 family protein [Candidatus Nitrososphaera evergladensis]AIF85240.1 hypothetical protein NTE_03211 [Candidatus Nitrososphaera evergladensis SR1]